MLGFILGLLAGGYLVYRFPGVVNSITNALIEARKHIIKR